MEVFKTLIIILLSSVLVNNYVLSRFLGICPFLGVSKKLNQAVGMGISVTAVMLLATAVTWPIQYLLLDKLGLGYMQNIIFILVIASLVQILELILKRFSPALHKGLGVYLPLITTNCAILGSALLCIQNEYNFITSVIFSFGSAVGFTLAIVVFSLVREKVALSDPPKCFRGVPMALVTAGLIAMAFSGFSSMKLPF